MAVQTVIRTVGVTGRQHSTFQLAEDLVGTGNLTTSEKSAAGSFAVAAFTIGETINFVGSSAVGIILETDSTGVGNGTYIIYLLSSGNPAASDVVTGATSGATCVLSSSTPTDVGIIYEPQGYNDGEFAHFTVSGQTTSASCYMHFTTAASQSFRDHADVQTNPLRYNQTVGVGIRKTTAYGSAIIIATHFTRFTKLQIAATGTAPNRAIAYPDTNPAQDGYVEFCITEATPQTGGSLPEVVFLGRSIIANSLVVNRSSNTGSGVRSYAPGAEAHYCTVVRPSDLTAAQSAFTETYDTAFNIHNCLAFGFTNFSTDATNFTGDNNGTDDATIGFGSSNLEGLTYADQFEVTTNATRDFRLKSGADVIGGGASDAPYSTTDIAGTARGVSFDMGCWQFVGGAPSDPSSPGKNIYIGISF